MIKNKTSFLATIVLAFAGMFACASSAYADVLDQVYQTNGTVVAIWPDPGPDYGKKFGRGNDEFVFALSNNGKCGSNAFHIDRTKSNAKEMVALVLTAFTTKKEMGAYVIECKGNRNLISHGFIH